MSIVRGSTLDAQLTPLSLTVNWSASLRPQHFLREQWAKLHNLPHFLSAEFADSIEFVCNRMGVSADHIKHNKANSRLVDASVKLGYPVAKIPVCRFSGSPFRLLRCSD